MLCILPGGPAAGKRGFAGRKRLVADCQVTASRTYAAHLALRCFTIAERCGVYRVRRSRWPNRLPRRRISVVSRNRLPSVSYAADSRPSGNYIEVRVMCFSMHQRPPTQRKTQMFANLSKLICAMMAFTLVAWSIGCSQQRSSTALSSASCCQQPGKHSCCSQEATQSPQGGQTRVVLAALGESDKTGIAEQRVCPVSGAQLGSMGDPVKAMVDGKPVYLCCQGCLSKVQSAPEAYLRKANQVNQVQ